MKVKMKVAPVGGKAGDTADVSDDEAKTLIAFGFAEKSGSKTKKNESEGN